MGESIPADWIINRCLDEGFALAGVCPADPPAWGAQFREWLDAGKHGEMGYLEDNFGASMDPNLVLDGAHSVVMVADLYATREDTSETPVPGQGRIARYARGKDYHRSIKKRLHAVCDDARVQYPGAQFRAFVDTAPVNEREMAMRCGLGWIAKHTLIIHPRLGSWMVLGGFLTTLKLEVPAEQPVIEDHCGTCSRCIEACPTDAITPYSVDATRCISYLTIEHRSAIDEKLAPKMGDWVAGCDICQEVCPHNTPKVFAAEHESHATHGTKRGRFDLLEILNWDEDARREALVTSPLKRVKLDQFRRNALIAAGNALRERELPELRARVEAIAGDASEAEMVRQAARWALGDRPAR